MRGFEPFDHISPPITTRPGIPTQSVIGVGAVFYVIVNSGVCKGGIGIGCGINNVEGSAIVSGIGDAVGSGVVGTGNSEVCYCG